MSLKLLLPNETDEVLKSWPTEPGVRRRGTTELDRDVTLSLIDAYIDYDCLCPQYVAVVRNGQAVHPGRYTRGGTVIPGRLRTLLDDGYTVNLREIQRSIPFLARMTRKIQQETGYPNHVSAIITPPGHQGLTHHWDQFTGVIAQITGRKRWPLWRPAVDQPMGEFLSSPRMWTPDLQKRLETSSPDTEFELAPGDTLVLPRGWIHSPYAVGGETSFHLTFALKERSWLWVAQQLIGLAVDDPSFRAGVPPAALAGGLEADLLGARGMAIRFLQHLDPVLAAERVRQAAVSEGAGAAG
ncbi:JmjC domain-containing protein [Streptomyces sp. RPT161]|uniref:JmjC domain-containing protein n=1 Tax=Streptomyces sp. RPT161 TaxID=3015993 RepID=UPI0022B90791|nr:cupin domain-containing protein [Streptomyces sp. RPT161]